MTEASEDLRETEELWKQEYLDHINGKCRKDPVWCAYCDPDWEPTFNFQPPKPKIKGEK